MKRTTAQALTVATTLAVAGAVAGSGALSSDHVASPAVETAAYEVTPATYAAHTLAPRTDTRSTFAERASRDAADRAARIKALKAAKLKAEKARAAKRAALERKKAAAEAKRAIAAGRSVSAGSVRAIGKRMAAEYGWTGAQWNALDNLWRAESNWGTTSGNPSGAYGIPQSLPGTKMASAGSDWMTNPATQIKWGLNYIEKRHGSPLGAWGHFQANHWY